jgi:hypothetical protein
MHTVRTLRLVCSSWREAAGTAVTYLAVPSLLSRGQPEAASGADGDADADATDTEASTPAAAARPLRLIFPELAALDLTNHQLLTDAGLAAAVTGCRCLSHLRLSAARLTPAGQWG